MWVNNAGDYVTNTQFFSDIPANPRPADIINVWRVDALTNDGYPFIPLMIDLVRLEYNPVRQNSYVCVYCPRTVDGHTVYPSKEDMLTTNGDAILLPSVINNPHDINAMYSVSGTHPIDPEGRWQYIKIGAIIKVMGQLYILKIVREIWNGNSGKITFTGEHIFYQMNDGWVYPGKRIYAFSGLHAIDEINARTTYEHREGSFVYEFDGFSDLDFTQDNYLRYINDGCTPIELLIGDGSILEYRGGELYRNNFYFSINERMENANDHAFDIRIGKNLTGIDRTVDMSSMCSFFKAYDPWGGWIAIAWDFGAFFGDIFPHYVVRSKNFQFPEEASQEGWDYGQWFSTVFVDEAIAFFKKNGKPIVRYEINLVDVRNNPDFKITGDENFRVGDKGIVYDERFGNQPLTVEITGTVYDGIHEKCMRVIIGDRQSFVSTSMPAVEWGTVPQIVGGVVPYIDGNGDILYDGNGDRLVQGVISNG